MPLKKVEDLKCEDFSPYLPNQEEIMEMAHGMLEDEINAIQERHSKSVKLKSEQTVENFDFLTLEIKLLNNLPEERSLRRFRKPEVQIRLGDSIFSQELEEQLIGEVVSSSKVYKFKHASYDIELEVKILSAERMLLPTKEEALELEYDSNEDYAEYKGLSFEEFKSKLLEVYIHSFANEYFIQHGFGPITRNLVEASNIVASEDDYAKDMDELEKSIEAAKDEGMDRLEFYRMMFGESIKDIDEGAKKAEEYMKNYTLLNLYSFKVCEDEGFVPDKDSYMKQIQDYSNDCGESVDSLLKQFPFEDYRRSKVQEYLSQKLLRKFNECLNLNHLA